MRTLTISQEFRPRVAFGIATTVPYIRLRGRWLEQHGFKPGAKVYVHEGVDGLTLTTTAPTQISEVRFSSDYPKTGLVDLEKIKSEYRALGISTEERSKKRKPAKSEEPVVIDPQSPAGRGEPFIVPTCGIANTDPLEMTDDNFSAWLGCITSEERRSEWIEKRVRFKLKSKQGDFAPQLAFTFGMSAEPIPIELPRLNKIELGDEIPPDELKFFKPKEMSARAYAEACKEN
jgi:hypothetical protein